MKTLEMLQGMFKEGKITRREFIQRASALGIAVAVSPALLGRDASAATPKKGGRFRQGVAGGSTTDSLDPSTITDAMCQNLNWQIRNSMIGSGTG